MTDAIRTLIALAICAALAFPAAAQDSFPEGTEISLLQWSHFVPAYDEWFAGYIREWGAANNVSVTVDHVNFAELPASLAAEIDAGQGHTIIELPSSPASLVQGLHDLSDLNSQANARFGQQRHHCKAVTYLPAVDAYYGFSAGYALNHGNYDIELWAQAGYPQGPENYEDLLAGGRAIYEATGIPVGIGISPEIDSEIAIREVIWSFGGGVQDARGNPAFNSPETVAAVKYLAQLQNEAMTAEVFGWTGASNNQALVAGDASFILNPDSAYRSLQRVDDFAAENIGFTPALVGPAGAFGGTHAFISVVPSYVEGSELEAAKKFLLDLAENYSQVTYNSELFNLPCFPATVVELDNWLENDPFGSAPADKFAVLKTAIERAVNFGFPGYSNPAIAQVYAEHIIPKAVAQVALGEAPAEDAVAAAGKRIDQIFARWRSLGLVGG
ncbi:MAG: carbohydrate ABC transporter substrate-binding protein [Chloroflexi bacterium]|nr:carbohydrate ABC transporter substrate-binding protein [Chloroflexota bacterium]